MKTIKIDIRDITEIERSPRTNQDDYLHIEMTELINNASDHLNTEDEYVIYCQSGARAGRTVNELLSLGYKVKYGGGIN